MGTDSIWPVVASLGVACAVALTARPSLASRLASRQTGRRAPPWLAGRSDALPVRVRALVGLGAGIALAAWAGMGGLAVVAGCVAGAGVFVALGLLSTSAATRRRAAIVAALPQACDLLAVCVEAGLPLRSTLRAVVGVLEGPLAECLARIVARVDLGVAEYDAWAEARVEPGLEALAREVCRCLSSGAPVASTLRALALEARRDALSDAEVRAKRVGVRSVLPLMLCFLPSFVLLGVVPIIGGVVANLLTGR